VGAGTLRASDKGVADVAARFDALLRYASLRLGRTLGTEIVPVVSRREAAEPALRTAALVDGLVKEGRLSGAIRIPHAVAPLNIDVDLRAGRVTMHVDVDAPREGRSTTRVNWLTRQLKAAPDSVRLEAFAMHTRGPGAADLLKSVREDPNLLIQDPKKELRSFRVALASPLGTKRGRGRGAAIDSVLDAVDTFYGEVLQHLKAWTAAPPRMREVADQPAERTALVSTALSSQDGVEPVDDVDVADDDIEESSEAAEIAQESAIS
jgi:hypothetical protein